MGDLVYTEKNLNSQDPEDQFGRYWLRAVYGHQRGKNIKYSFFLIICVLTEQVHDLCAVSTFSLPKH